MHVEARMAEQPFLNKRRLVGAVVVEDEVHVEVGRNLLVDVIQESVELRRAVPAVGPLR